MRAFLLCVLLSLPCAGQSAALPAATSQVQEATEVNAALSGRWVGTLEYRDYSEPATSTKRVQLPTWMTIRKAPEGVYVDRVYDDGPGKVVKEHATLVVDQAAKRYKLIATDSAVEAYQIAGLEQLKNGRGTLVLTGEGTDNGKPAQVRTTLVIGGNLLSWLEEVRAVGTTEAFVFRHKYTFVRAEAPEQSR